METHELSLIRAGLGIVLEFLVPNKKTLESNPYI
jgi:hypothetical protein